MGFSPALAVSTVDGVVLALVGLMVLRGLWKGFAWQAVRTVGLVGALWGATAWHEPIGRRLASTFGFLPDAAAPWVAWVTLVVALFLAAAYLAWVARGLVQQLQLGGLDRLLGIASGAALGLLLATAGVLAWASFVPDAHVRDALRGSVTAPWMGKTVDLLEPILPADLRQRWRGVLATPEQASGARGMPGYSSSSDTNPSVRMSRAGGAGASAGSPAKTSSGIS
jgi:uncharacterized membrane protein required for colicin V production